MALTRWPKPDHVHIEPSCIDHTACGSDHWEGGRPEADHPHWVEIDCSSGVVGYTRLTDSEIAERESEAAESRMRQAAMDAELRGRVNLIRARARDDPAFKALAEHLGVALEQS